VNASGRLDRRRKVQQNRIALRSEQNRFLPLPGIELRSSGPQPLMLMSEIYEGRFRRSWTGGSAPEGGGDCYTKL